MSAEERAEGNFYIELSKNPIRFEPVGQVTNVFFDDSNLQVFAVRSGGAAGVVVKGADERKNVTFRMEDQGDVISMKFSPDMKILALQRSAKSVEFMNFMDGHDASEYSQPCKGKSTKIIGFTWTSTNEIVFVTDFGIEFYQVIPEKKMLKLTKNFTVQIHWYSWLAESGVMLLSTGVLGNIMMPFFFKQPGTMMKLAKFDIDLPSIPRPPKLALLERDVTMATLYNKLYVVVLRHQPKTGGSPGAEIVLYHIPKENPAKKSDVLKLDMSGRFAVNIVDNLIIVHHQSSKTSMMYDIQLSGETDGYITYHQPVISPLPMKPFKLRVQGLPTSQGIAVQQYNCEMYSPNWIAFQPDIIIDAKLGCMWYTKLCLEPVISMIPDKCRLMDFLLLRRDSKMVILMVCKQILSLGSQAKLTTIARIFNMLNKVYYGYLEAEVQALATDQQNPRRRTPVIDQSDMYTHVFSAYADNTDMPYKFMVSVLVEYIRSLNHFQIPVQHYLYELVINTLVQHNCFYQLHQFLQYHVLSDSKPLACLLLSLEGVYPPAHQLALDMLKRLGTANEQIVEVLLSKYQLLPAIRFLRSVGAIDQISARKFLEAAKTTEDKMIFYTVFKFFEQRNIRLRGSPRFASGEHCEQYTQHFEALFGAPALV